MGGGESSVPFAPTPFLEDSPSVGHAVSRSNIVILNRQEPSSGDYRVSYFVLLKKVIY